MSRERKSTRKRKLEVATETPPSAQSHFNYVTLMDNLPGDYAGIATVSEQPCGPDDPERESVIARTWEQHKRRLEDIRLGVGKGRRELRQEANAIHQVPRSEAEQTKPTHSADFTSVKCFGADYRFVKGLQAESVRALWEAWENGTPSLAEKTIAEKIGSSNDRFRLEHVFKPTNKKTRKREAHPAWGTMIKRVGKGTFALSPQ